MRRIFITLALVLSFASVNAQNSAYPWALSFDLNAKRYNGDLGNNIFATTDFNMQYGVTGYRYINRFLDAGLGLSYGKYTFTNRNNKAQTFSSFITDPNLFLRFKLDNGSILKENAKIGPFIKAGIGFNMLKNVSMNPAESYSFLNIPVGAGFRIKFNDRFNVSYEATYNLNSSDEYDGLAQDGNDKYLNHKVSFVFGMNCNGGEDADKDGVPDKRDRCPGTPEGTAVDFYGCPKISNEETDRVKLLAKDINFEFDSDKITAESYPALDEVVSVLKKHPGARVAVNGHTDNQGDDDYNLGLSQRRAQSVKDYLVSKGIDTKRVTAKGYGETDPIDSNDTPEGRARNRRVEFLFTY